MYMYTVQFNIRVGVFLLNWHKGGTLHTYACLKPISYHTSFTSHNVLTSSIKGPSIAENPYLVKF